MHGLRALQGRPEAKRGEARRLCAAEPTLFVHAHKLENRRSPAANRQSFKETIMLRRVSHLTASSVTAADGAIGNVTAAFFDDQSWAIRYLVVDTEKWLPAREVLISPYSISQPLPDLSDDKNIHVRLTREQVKASPDIDTHQPVSRQHEREYSAYYTYPEYWDGGDMWGMGGLPLMATYPPSPEQIAAAETLRARDLASADSHLRSSVKVVGYDIQATDDSIGHVADFVFDDRSWAIRYLIVDTRNWWPGGKKVLVPTHWIDSIDWATSSVHVGLTREGVKASPEYDETIEIDRAYETRLHTAYNRKSYWD